MMCECYTIITSLPTAPADYTSVSMALTYNSGNTGNMLCISIFIEDDNVCENSETIFVDLTSTDPNAITVPPTSTSVTITDNDGEFLIPHRVRCKTHGYLTLTQWLKSL